MLRNRTTYRRAGRIFSVLLIAASAMFVMSGTASAAPDKVCHATDFHTPDGKLDIASYLLCLTAKVTPDTIEQGSTGPLNFSGGGCMPNSEVRITLDDTIDEGTTTADGRGIFSVDISVPSTLALGEHHFTASCTDNTGGSRAVSGIFKVVPVGAGGGNLPRTGGDTTQLVAIGIAMVGLGLAASYGSRRYRLARVNHNED